MGILSRDNLMSILLNFKNKVLDKDTYKGSDDGIVKKADEAIDLVGVKQAPLFSVYMKDKNGDYGWKPFPISVSKDDLNNYSATILNAKSGTTYEIALKEDREFFDVICQVYKFIPGQDNLVKVIKTFNNMESANFDYNVGIISFENGMHINNMYKLDVSVNKDGLFESSEIDSSQFKDIYIIK